MLYLRAHNLVRSTMPIIPHLKWNRRFMVSNRKKSAQFTPYHMDAHSESEDTTWRHPVYASESVRDRKSVFLAHATRLSTTQEVPTFIKYLTSLPELKRATHCMYAYRISDRQTSQILCGQQDGGEGGSGDRLSRLLDLSGSENVIVVVSRWYGGIALGSDRWKRISTVAKEALAKGVFLRKTRDEHLKAQTQKKKK